METEAELRSVPAITHPLEQGLELPDRDLAAAQAVAEGLLGCEGCQHQASLRQRMARIPCMGLLTSSESVFANWPA